MKLKSGFENKRARVEMLPLIDVVFLLLVFFIYAFLSMVLHRGIDVDLPSATSATLNKQDYIDVTISSDNQISVNRQIVDLPLVAETVQALRQSPDDPVFIHGDRAAHLGIAVELLDHLRTAGINKVSFACKEKE